jgi:hypothetical protein
VTNRQRTLIQRIQPQLSDVYRLAAQDLALAPVGWMSRYRVSVPFVTGWMGALPACHVLVFKDRDGFKFRVDEGLWPRKGWTEPKWRPLHA